MKAEFVRHQFLRLWLNHEKLQIDKFLGTLASLNERGLTREKKIELTDQSILELKGEVAKLEGFNRYLSYPIRSGGDISRYLTKNLEQLVVDGLRDNGYADSFYAYVKALQQKYELARTKVADAFFAFHELGVDDITPDIMKSVFIEVSFPQNAKIDIEDFGKDISGISRDLKLLSDSFGGPLEEFKLFAVSSSRISLLIESSYKYVTCFSAVIYFLLEAASSIQDIRLKTVELNKQLEGGYGNEFVDKVVGDIAQKCSQKIMEDFFKDNDGANFSAERCAVGVRSIYDKIEKGFRFDIHVPSETGPVATTDKSGTIEEEKRARLRNLAGEIAMRFDSLPPPPGTPLLTDQTAVSD
jgi:hypothetical protein